MRVVFGFFAVLSLSAPSAMAETPAPSSPSDVVVPQSILERSDDTVIPPPVPHPSSTRTQNESEELIQGEEVPAPIVEAPSELPAPSQVPQARVNPAPRAVPPTPVAPRTQVVPQIQSAPSVPVLPPVVQMAPQGDAVLYESAGELSAVLTALQAKQFCPDAGHAMAASQLVNCAPVLRLNKRLMR